MSRSIFGWSYPPGAAGDPNAPYNQQDGPCGVCLNSIDDCVCPECTVCHTTGDPACYISFSTNDRHHGLVMTKAQSDARAWNLNNQAEAESAELERQIDDRESR